MPEYHQKDGYPTQEIKGLASGWQVSPLGNGKLAYCNRLPTFQQLFSELPKIVLDRF